MPLTTTAATRGRIAFTRFGFGPKPGSLATLGDGPTAAYDKLVAELNNPKAALNNDPALPSYKDACALGAAKTDRGPEQWALNRQERHSSFNKHQAVEIGFVERLVQFWTNHFSICRDKNGLVAATVGQWHRSVVRRHVLGKFTDMLVGTITHPAMIVYLDNHTSFGPNSLIGKSWKRSYNENLAREILELHTLGINGGYTQADVTNFAKVLTGWSFVSGWDANNIKFGGNEDNRGQFIYRDDRHEPGAFEVFGKTYAQSGQEQGLAVLKDLAIHPKTAEHIAYKLVQHFITDTPTKAMVDPIAEAFLATSGDLKATALALINLPEAFGLPLGKRIRRPYEMMASWVRALLVNETISVDRDWAIDSPMGALQHAPYTWQTPDGFPDEDSWWLSPDAMRLRVEGSRTLWWGISPQYKGTTNIADLATSLFDSALSAETKTAITAQKKREEAISMLLMSPEFQRS
jgi:uncharacterized protein (DUF1800 family)